MAEIKITDTLTGYTSTYVVPRGVKVSKINRALNMLAGRNTLAQAILVTNLRGESKVFFRKICALWSTEINAHRKVYAEQKLQVWRKNNPDGSEALDKQVAENAAEVEGLVNGK